MMGGVLPPHNFSRTSDHAAATQEKCFRTETRQGPLQKPDADGGSPAGSGFPPREGVLSADGFHQGAGNRLLHSDLAGVVAAPERSAADTQTLSRWSGRHFLL